MLGLWENKAPARRRRGRNPELISFSGGGRGEQSCRLGNWSSRFKKARLSAFKASAQLASLPSVPTETIFGLLLFFLVAFLSIIALVYLRRRMYSVNFQALDRIVDALPGKGEKNGSQKKTLQLEC